MKIVPLVSGGIDSSIMTFLLNKEGHELFPLFIDYGQLAAKKEWEACQSFCNYLGFKPQRMDISGFGKLVPSGITTRSLDIEKDAFLPSRNLLFLTLGASYGSHKSAYIVAIGLLANPIFPDQTDEFVQISEKSISTALGVDIKILTPLISLNKTDIIGLARKYELPLDRTYSCHSGNEKPCGNCISCKERIIAERYFSNKNATPH